MSHGDLLEILEPSERRKAEVQELPGLEFSQLVAQPSSSERGRDIPDIRYTRQSTGTGPGRHEPDYYMSHGDLLEILEPSERRKAEVQELPGREFSGKRKGDADQSSRLVRTARGQDGETVACGVGPSERRKAEVQELPGRVLDEKTAKKLAEVRAKYGNCRCRWMRTSSPGSAKGMLTSRVGWSEPLGVRMARPSPAGYRRVE
jgi:hypothetical protein